MDRTAPVLRWPVFRWLAAATLGLALVGLAWGAGLRAGRLRQELVEPVLTSYRFGLRHVEIRMAEAEVGHLLSR